MHKTKTLLPLFLLVSLLVASCTAPATSTPSLVSTAEIQFTEVPSTSTSSVEPVTETTMPSMETPNSTQESVSTDEADDSDKGTEVEIEDFAFQSDALTVKVGTTVVWTNKDKVAHTVTSDAGLFDSGLFAKGESFSFTFTEVGVFSYYCIPHPYMKGTVTVVE